MGHLRVQHCVLNQTTRQYGHHPTSDLLGVDYTHTVPADTEFPGAIRRLELFVRFICHGRMRGRVVVTITHLNRDGSDGPKVYRKPFDLPSSQNSGFIVYDKGYKLVDILVPGEGT